MTESVAPSLEIAYVPLASVHPNDWNPNRQTEAVAAAEADSIERFGFIDPVTVRAHPELDGEWQVIDGEHRLLEAEKQGHELVPIIPVQATDDQARKLTLILNETRGEADVLSLGRLLHDLQERLDGDVEELLHGLPFSLQELDHLTRLGATDWDQFRASLPGSEEEKAEEGTPTFVLEGTPEIVNRLHKRVPELADRWDEAPAVAVLRAVEEALGDD